MREAQVDNGDRGKIRMFVDDLLEWGSKNRRRFAWRESEDPYSVLVAELLLQRTMARQVEPVYYEFMKKFPDARALADASLESIAGTIQPLGLAYRAPRLKAIAKVLVERHGGLIPESESELLELPGIGKYIANAILCFAFGRDVPVVDTNVARIAQRVFGLNFGREPHKKREFREFMKRMIPRGRARDFNLSLLDHANLICTPKHPKCLVCPLNRICRFYGQRIIALR